MTNDQHADQNTAQRHTPYTDYPHFPRRVANDGHGHIYPRPDGQRVRCGGPTGCPACADDALEAASAWAHAAISAGAEPVELHAAVTLLHGAALGAALQRDRSLAAAHTVTARRESGFGSAATGMFQQDDSAWGGRR